MDPGLGNWQTPEVLLKNIVVETWNEVMKSVLIEQVRRIGTVTVAVTVLTVILQQYPQIAPLLELRPIQDLSPLSFLTVLTGNLVHWSGDHLFWDLIVFVSCGVILERYWGSRTFAFFLLFAAVAVSLSVLIAESTLLPYRGLSGVAVAAVCALIAPLVTTSLVAQLLLVGMIAKVTFEAVTRATLFADSTSHHYIVSVAAHVAGACVGFLFGFLVGEEPSNRNALIEEVAWVPGSSARGEW